MCTARSEKRSTEDQVLTDIRLVIKKLISGEVSAQLTNLAASNVEIDVQVILAETHVEVVQLIWR